uniref:Uncharacterized protein n=1 Tax=Klebsiella pneumoniae TaxID=573 RepID=A0A8B0SYW5_KLEPN|nr:hypothetical protein [Klebsiella pneumoniae]
MRRSAVAGEPKESQHELHDKNPVKPAKFFSFYAPDSGGYVHRVSGTLW